jgi:hypothetical protein
LNRFLSFFEKTFLWVTTPQWNFFLSLSKYLQNDNGYFLVATLTGGRAPAKKTVPCSSIPDGGGRVHVE